MFCPVCEAEYEPGITECPDDNTALVDQLTPENTLHDLSEARFVSLHKLGSPAEAEMVNDLFTQNGIRSIVKAGGADSFSPLLSATSEGAEIFVGRFFVADVELDGLADLHSIRDGDPPALVGAEDVVDQEVAPLE